MDADYQDSVPAQAPNEEILPAIPSSPSRNRSTHKRAVRSYQLRLVQGEAELGSLILHGDAFTHLKTIPSNSVRCCVTSPPYWGLRDYGIPHQIGAEPELNDYIGKLRDVFAEVHRVLKADGTLWLNIGDGYTSGNRTWRDSDKKNAARGMSYRPPTPKGLKSKDLLGIPWRLAFALQDAGWFLRADVIWHKPNAQPESVKDRPTRAHEYMFLFSKCKNYYYDYAAIQEPAAENGKPNGNLRNRRTVWSINTEPYEEAHFATFPPQLIRPCILAGSQEGDIVLDPFFGAGTVGLVCMELNRRFIGVELSADYVALAKRRLGQIQETKDGESPRRRKRTAKAERATYSATSSASGLLCETSGDPESPPHRSLEADRRRA